MSLTITYELGKNLYVNTTNRCDCACLFCLRAHGKGVGSAEDLWIPREPTREEIWADIQRRDLSQYGELVFCGYGEPTYRMEEIAWVCDQVRKVSSIRIRMDTNGHGSLIAGRDIAPLFQGRFDVVSVSLNAATPEAYVARCLPKGGPAAYAAMLDFTRQVRNYVPTVMMTVVDTMDNAEIEACHKICEGLGATFRVREYIE